MTESEITIPMNPGIKFFLFFSFFLIAEQISVLDISIYGAPRMSEILILNCWMQSNQYNLRDQDPRVKHDIEKTHLFPILF